MPSKNQILPIPSPQFSEQQNRVPSLDTAELQEDMPALIPIPESAIAAYAYQLYEEGGRQNGRSAEYWAEAEKKLRANPKTAKRV